MPRHNSEYAAGGSIALVHFDWDSATSVRGREMLPKVRAGGTVAGAARGCKGRIIKVKYSVYLLYGERKILRRSV